MSGRRFVPPLRAQVDPACLDHPLLQGYARWRGLLASAQWPSLVRLNAAVPVAGKQFAGQDAALLADGLHYEQRIAAGLIATRQDNWHDLFNALVWGRYPAIKRALNAAQCRQIALHGSTQRSPAQQALTQFDESGLLLRTVEPALLAAWDRHDWYTLFVEQAEAWCDGRIGVAAGFGHALLEQLLLPGRRLVGKCIVVLAEDDAQAQAALVAAISLGQVLQRADELRPLPLAGIPGWYAGQDAAFYADSSYFRPLRAGRCYPPPLR